MKHNSHHGHFEAPREKRRLTGKQKGIIGIVLALAVLAGVATGTLMSATSCVVSFRCATMMVSVR